MQPQAFDVYAPRYDGHFTNSLIGKAQRSQVYRHLLKAIPAGTKHVLEVNCGTGHDAAWFAEQGMEVLATDISEGMLSVARQKEGNNTVRFKQLKSQDIGTLQPALYDLIFSNFGGLNCLSPQELMAFKNGCSVLQTGSGRLALVIMSNGCWWERLYYKYKKNNPAAHRRKNKAGVDTAINGVNFKTYYYSPGDIKYMFSAQYSAVTVKPIGLFVPPSYMEGYFKNRKFLLKCLVTLDKLFGRFSSLSNYADHFLIILEKKIAI